MLYQQGIVSHGISENYLICQSTFNLLHWFPWAILMYRKRCPKDSSPKEYIITVGAINNRRNELQGNN
jgi:hypothetical protein